MLGPINLGGFTQDGRAAVRYQQINGSAQRRVGADARVPVRAAALQPDGDVRGAAGLALDGIGLRQHLFDERNAFGHGFGGATRVLDVEHAQGFALAQAALGQPGLDLVGLTTQPDHQHARKVGVGGIARQRALQKLQAQAFTVHAAARAVREGNHAIDVGEVF